MQVMAQLSAVHSVDPLDYVLVSGDMTDDITLYEGAWPVRYSDRTAGILAVDTREGNLQGFQG